MITSGAKVICRGCGGREFKELTAISLEVDAESKKWFMRRCSNQACRRLNVLRESRCPRGSKFELMVVPRSYSDQPLPPTCWRLLARTSSGRESRKIGRIRRAPIRG